MVLDFADELIRENHEVVIFTREYANPIQSCFTGLKSKVFVGALPNELHEKFDLAIAFHAFTIKVLLKNGFKPKKLIYFSLGPSEPFETPPVINKGVFGLGCFNSQETFEHYLNHGYVCKEDSLVFPNSVADSFFCDVPTKALPTKISKVAIITNHSSSLHTELKKLLSLNLEDRKTQKILRREWLLSVENKRRSSIGLEAFASYDELNDFNKENEDTSNTCLLYTSPSPRDMRRSRMPSSA